MAKTKELEKLGVAPKASKTPGAKGKDKARSKKPKKPLGIFVKKAEPAPEQDDVLTADGTGATLEPQSDKKPIKVSGTSRRVSSDKEDGDSAAPKADSAPRRLNPEGDDDIEDDSAIKNGGDIISQEEIDRILASLAENEEAFMENVGETDWAIARSVKDFDDVQLWEFCNKNFPDCHAEAFAVLKKLTQKLREDEAEAVAKLRADAKAEADAKVKVNSAASNTRPVPPPPMPVPAPMPTPAPMSYYGGFPIEGFGEAFLYFSREEKEFMLTSDFWAAKLYGTKWDKVYAWYENGVPVRIATEREREEYLPKSTILKT